MYERVSDEKLRELALRPQDLTPSARVELESECRRRGLWEEPPPFEDPPLPPGATGCADHPGRAVAGVCRRCGRFICYRCDRQVGPQLAPLGADPPQGLCGACREREVGAAPLRIGGWLLLLGVGLLLSPLNQLRSIWGTAGLLQSGELSRPAHWVVVLELAVSAAYLALTLYAVGRFFLRRTDTPRWLIGLLVAALAHSVLQQVAERTLEGEVSWSEGLFYAPALRAAIWIPYLLFSTRVKRTFVL